MLEIIDKIRKIGAFKKDGFEVIFVGVPIKKSENIISLRDATEKKLVEVSEVATPLPDVGPRVEILSRSVDSQELENQRARVIPVEIRELTIGGEVSALKIRNLSDKFIVAFRGDILIGGKQNRTLVTTVILAPHSEQKVPVSCVEAGRWSFMSKSMKQNLRLPQLMKLQNMAFESRLESRSQLLGHPSRRELQQVVWDNIEKRLNALKIASPTKDITKAISENVTPDMFPVPEGTTGIIFIFDGKVIGGEIYFIPINESYLKESIVSAYIDYLYYKQSKIDIKSPIGGIDELLNALKNAVIEERDSLFAERVSYVHSGSVRGFITYLKDTPVFFEFSIIEEEKQSEDLTYT